MFKLPFRKQGNGTRNRDESSTMQKPFYFVFVNM